MDLSEILNKYILKLKNTSLFIFLSKNINKFWFQGPLVFLVFVIINIKYYLYYIRYPIIAGWDSMGHYAAGLYYIENIFPRMWGWIPGWYAGTPFPDFYPPLFYFAVALIQRITFIPYIWVFKFSVLIMLALVPVLLVWLARAIDKNNKTFHWFTAFFAIVFISFFNHYDMGLGVGIGRTLGTGLIPYLLGFLLLIIFIRYLLILNFEKKFWFLKTFIFSLVLISNVHIVPVAMIFWGCTFLIHLSTQKLDYKFFFQTLLYYLASFVIAFLAVSFWYIPLIANYDFVTAANQDDFGKGLQELLLNNWIIFLMLVYLSFKNYNKFIFTYITYLAFMYFLIIIKPGIIFPDIVMHVSRWSAPLVHLFPIIIGLITSYVYKMKHGNIRCLLAILIVIYSGSFIKDGWSTRWPLFPLNKNDLNIVEFVDTQREINMDEIESVIDYYKKNKNNNTLNLVEKRFTFGRHISDPHSTNLESLFVINNINTTWGVLRESSVSSPLLTAIRNTISELEEHWGINTILNLQRDFLDSNDVDEKINRANYIGISDFIVFDQNTINELSSSKNVTLEKDFGTWKLFTSNKWIDRVEILNNIPVLLFTETNFKQRTALDINFSRFSELILEQNTYDINFVKNKNYIEDEDFSKFALIFIDQYYYKDIDKAFEKIKDFTSDRMIIVYKREDDLFNKIEELYDKGNENIIILNVPKYYSSNDTISNQFPEIVDLIRKNNINLKIPADLKIDYVFNKDSVKIDFSEKTDYKYPIYIKTTYSNNWSASNGQNIYMSSPSFVVVYADDDFEIKYTQSKYSKIGYLLSTITTVLFLIGLIYYYLNKKNKYI